LTGGLYGPLIVLEPGEKFDPATDKTFVFGRGGVNEWTAPLLINGNSQPPAMVLKAGTKYRFRLINITTNDVHLMVELEHRGKAVQWRAISKDGAALPPKQAVTMEARQDVTVGETRDFEFTPAEMGNYELKVSTDFPAPLVATQTMFTPPPIPSR
jgi:FtsP/CotA-like multicopper oxidase with cupredoxin domain